MGVMYLLENGTITNELVIRYLTGHPISKVTMGMFLVGMGSLGLILFDVIGQFWGERKISLDVEDQNHSNRPAAIAENLASQLLKLPKKFRQHYLWQRLFDSIRYIDRTETTAQVDNELKYFSDLDVERQSQRYALIRILVWATPMLGFLGTVLGISQALGGINVGPDNDFSKMMDGLRGSLYVAFDTTALALTLSMVMMFVQFLVDKFETQLLRLVDNRVNLELERHFDLTEGPSTEFSERVAQINQDSIVQQTELWKKTITAAESAWISSLSQSNAVIQQNLTEALDENIARLAHYLGEAIDRADVSMTHRWNQWQVTLSDNARMVANQQQELVTQTRELLDVIQNFQPTQDGIVDTPAVSLPESPAVEAEMEAEAEIDSPAKDLMSVEPLESGVDLNRPDGTTDSTEEAIPVSAEGEEQANLETATCEPEEVQKAIEDHESEVIFKISDRTLENPARSNDRGVEKQRKQLSQSEVILPFPGSNQRSAKKRNRAA